MSNKNTQWFRHDANARGDPKIAELRMSGGWELVGCYWAVIEMLREAESDKYRITNDHIGAISYHNMFPENAIDEMIAVGLLVTDGEWFWSESLIGRMAKLDEIKEKRRIAGSAGGAKKSKCLANAKQLKKHVKAKSSDLNRVELSRVERNIKETHDASFGCWWSAVGHKIGKKKAESAWNRIQKAKRWDDAKWAELAKKLTEHQDRLVSNGASPIHPATWLNGERWEDQSIPLPSAESPADRARRMELERLDAQIREDGENGNEKLRVEGVSHFSD
jgi:hypothetical protein